MELTVGISSCISSSELLIPFSLSPITIANLHLVHAAAQHPHLQTDAVQRQAHILL